MKMLMLAGATVLAVMLLPPTVYAQNVAASDGPGQFRFHLEELNTPRGKAVEGYIYNDSPWSITNVRLRV